VVYYYLENVKLITIIIKIIMIGIMIKNKIHISLKLSIIIIKLYHKIIKNPNYTIVMMINK